MHTAIYPSPLRRQNFTTLKLPSCCHFVVDPSPQSLPLLVFYICSISFNRHIHLPDIGSIVSLKDEETEAQWIFLPSFPGFILEIEWLVFVCEDKGSHSLRLPGKMLRYLRSCTGKDQVSSENHALFPQTWALCWKDIRAENQHYLWVRSAFPGLLL